MVFSSAVLTGGAGRRMGAIGTAKPLLVLGGRPLAAYAMDTLQQSGATEVLAIGGDGEAAAGLRDLGFVVIEDTHPGRGPLEGIVRALEVATAPLVAVLACDTPFITAATVAKLVDAAGDRGSIASTDGRLEPLIAVYGHPVLAELATALEADGAVHRVLERLDLPTVAIDPGEAFNVNAPADLEEAERRLRRLDRPSL
ncbi:MAG TPA: molybdenum cofactor guanylyltransferase [Acidimicrobiales bacterium]|nr:molybdenum cofactor guanylyltransferase [Acidimicrobiales bacterium]